MSKNQVYEFENGLRFEYDSDELDSLTELEYFLLKESLKDIESQFVYENLSKEKGYNYILSEGCDLFETSLRELIANRWVSLNEGKSNKRESIKVKMSDVYNHSKITKKNRFKY